MRKVRNYRKSNSVDIKIKKIMRDCELMKLAQSIAAERYENGSDRIPVDDLWYLEDVKRASKYYDDASIFYLLVKNGKFK